MVSSTALFGVKYEGKYYLNLVTSGVGMNHLGQCLVTEFSRKFNSGGYLHWKNQMYLFAHNICPQVSSDILTFSDMFKTHQYDDRWTSISGSDADYAYVINMDDEFYEVYLPKLGRYWRFMFHDLDSNDELQTLKRFMGKSIIMSD